MQSRSDTTPIAQQQSLTAQMKHLDMMCVTLERQIDVLSNVDQALPPTGKFMLKHENFHIICHGKIECRPLIKSVKSLVRFLEKLLHLRQFVANDQSQSGR